MLVFGPYSCVPKNSDFIIFNLSSLTQEIPRLPGLVIEVNENQIYNEKMFDMWYYDYVLNDPTACSSLMQILIALYETEKVYICISDYLSNSYMSIINESFMKIIQQRYDIKYSIVNTRDDWEYIPRDGCDFASINGIYNFDEDKKRYMLLCTENNIQLGKIQGDQL